MEKRDRILAVNMEERGEVLFQEKLGLLID